ncbi:hypothetical protein G6L00_06230 [Agrobacterium rhizogenes]|nr:hypothetical protein [Rhizobium rhizogenes]
MPTGFTAPVGDGEITSLRAFALRCARGMGATISMRDEPLDAIIPDEFHPSIDSYQAKLAAAKTLLSEIDQMSDLEASRQAIAEYKEQLRGHNAYSAEKTAINKRYEAMLSKVLAWETPTEGIKEFMIEQLQISIDRYISSPPERIPVAEWRRLKRTKAIKDISYYEQAIADEIHRVALRNAWICALRSSLPEE